MLVIVAPVSTSRLLALAAGAWTAAAALVSLGGLAFTGPSAASFSGSRFGVIPVDAASLAIAAIAALVVVGAGWHGRAAAVAVAPLALVFLPWLPLPVPAAFLAWQGALGSLAWLASLVALALAARPAVPQVPWRRAQSAAAPALAAAIIFSAAAAGSSSSIPGGDEPHYLVITQSLLYDRDLAIENNHVRGDYRAYFAGDLAPDSRRRGRDGRIYSIHAPGVPAAVLPAFAIGGYRGVILFLVLIAAAACGLAWWLAWRVTGSRAAAWFGWGAVVCAAPFVLESFTVYPDGPGAAVVLTGFWALLRAEWEQADPAPRPWWPWFLHGAALAFLPWMHTRFAVLAGTLGGLVLVRIARTPEPLTRAIAFLSAPAISALAWLFFFTVIYGAPDPSAPYGAAVESSFAYLPNGLGGILFDQGFGLLATAPVIAAAFAGFARARRLALEWTVVAVPYLLAVTTFAMWWGGWSGPARFLVPLLLPLAIPAACAWTAYTSRGARAVLLAALIVSAWLSALMAGAGAGRLGYHTRNDAGLTAAPWMQWASTVVDLPSAFPAFVPQPVQPDPGGRVSRANAARTGFAATIPWVVSLGAAAAFVVLFFRRRSATPETIVAAGTVAFAVAAMIAMSVVWRIHGADRITATAAQLDVLRRLAAGPVLALDLEGRRRLTPDEAWAMRIEAPVRRRGAGGRLNRPLAAFPAVPAGSYLLTARRQGSAEGWMMVGVGNDQFAIVTQPIAAFDAGVRIDLPLPVRALLVRADEGARDQLQAVELRPLPRADRAVSRDVARRAVRYEAGTAFFVDDRSFPEPAGFWVAGARASTVAIQPDQRRAIPLVLRNGAVDNQVSLASGTWRDEFRLGAGEEYRIDVPIDASGAALVTIRSAAGFRPSEVDASSRDTRLLGVFVQVKGR
ncbi:MAG TPA: hypothetical protein VFK57_02340 [Vicinamibacterales bacterium]|nr:hypothetical protein [Vicinamibacterales bacterium]